MANEVFMQKEELARALKYLSPAITMKGQGNESMVGLEFLPGGLVVLKAGADTVRTQTTCSWSGDPIPEPGAKFAIESHYLANALRTLGVASEVRLKIRDDQRLEFYLPGNKGAHVIPVQENEFQEIEDVLEDAETVFTDTSKLEGLHSSLQRSLVMWGLVTSAEREVAQMVVNKELLTVCSPGFYFTESKTGLPEGLEIPPEVAEKTARFVDKWKGREAEFFIFKTKRWGQTWGLIKVKLGDSDKTDYQVGATWMFQVRIVDESTDALNATILRMNEDKAAKSGDGMLKIVVANAFELGQRLVSAVSVTEDTHVTGQIKIVKGHDAVLVLSSKNAMSATSKFGVGVQVQGVTDDMDVDSVQIEWKVAMTRDILSIFGKNRVVITYDPKTQKTYFTEYTSSEAVEGDFEKEVFMTHVGRVIETKAKPREKRDRKPRKKPAVIVGGTDEGFSEIMEGILDE